MSSKWLDFSPASDPLVWRTLWTDPEQGSWAVEESERKDGGWARRTARLRLGTTPLAGAVAVCVRERPDGYQVLLVRQVRPAPGRVLWELPRGEMEAGELPEETARRELQEETGVAGSSAVLLGEVYPETGVLASRVGVVLLRASQDQRIGTEPNPETLQAGWFETSGVEELMRTGHLRDCISLAALSLAALWLSSRDAPR